MNLEQLKGQFDAAKAAAIPAFKAEMQAIADQGFKIKFWYDRSMYGTYYCLNLKPEKKKIRKLIQDKLAIVNSMDHYNEEIVYKAGEFPKYLNDEKVS